MKFIRLVLITVSLLICMSCNPDEPSDIVFEPDDDLLTYTIPFCKDLFMEYSNPVYCGSRGCYPGGDVPYAYISNLQPTLDWDGVFETIGGDECIPYSYEIRFMKHNPHFNQDGFQYWEELFRVFIGEGGWSIPNTEYALDFQLEENSIYSWRLNAYSGEGNMGWMDANWYTFVTGPYCANIGELGDLDLVYPEDGSVLDTDIKSPVVYFIFSPVKMDCVPPNYEIQISTQVDFQTYESDNLSFMYAMGESNIWENYPDCQNYYWRVRPIAEDGSYGAWSGPSQFQLNYNNACSNNQSSEEIACTYTALVNLNCRAGPGGEYESIGFFFPNQSSPILGKSGDDIYLYVTSPDTNVQCTVPNNTDYGITEGDCSGIPEIIMPTPTPEPTPAEEGCTVEILGPSGGPVLECVVPCPEDAVPGDPCTP